MTLHVCDHCKKQIKLVEEVRSVVSDPYSVRHFAKEYVDVYFKKDNLCVKDGETV